MANMVNFTMKTQYYSSMSWHVSHNKISQKASSYVGLLENKQSPSLQFISIWMKQRSSAYLLINHNGTETCLWHILALLLWNAIGLAATTFSQILGHVKERLSLLPSHSLFLTDCTEEGIRRMQKITFACIQLTLKFGKLWTLRSSRVDFIKRIKLLESQWV